MTERSDRICPKDKDGGHAVTALPDRWTQTIIIKEERFIMAQKKVRVVVVGSSNTDMVIKSQRLPKRGETIIGGRFVLAAGGKGANQAVAAARLGVKVGLVARVGYDLLGNLALDRYKKEGIAIKNIIQDEGHATGVALILVDAKGENMISVASGANEFLSPTDVEQAEPVIAGAKVVVVQLETSLDVLACTAKLAKKHGKPLILDPAPAPDEPLPTEILRNVTCIKPNEHEAERLTGIKVTDAKSALRAADELLEQGVKAVVVTLGKNGCLFSEKQNNGIHIQGIDVEAVDSTAAGDAFCGALAYGISQRYKLDDAALLANRVAALSVTRMGAQPSLPTKSEVEAFLKK